MADLEAEFKAATDWVEQNASSLSDAVKTEFYGLFKQATVGDNNISRPGIFDQKGRIKWDAWDGRKGMGQEDAKKAYIKLVEEHKAK